MRALVWLVILLLVGAVLFGVMAAGTEYLNPLEAQANYKLRHLRVLQAELELEQEKTILALEAAATERRLANNEELRVLLIEMGLGVGGACLVLLAIAAAYRIAFGEAPLRRRSPPQRPAGHSPDAPWRHQDDGSDGGPAPRAVSEPPPKQRPLAPMPQPLRARHHRPSGQPEPQE